VEGSLVRDADLMDVAEKLAGEFEEMPAREVLHVVASSMDQFPQGDPLFIEQAARAQLAARGGTEELELTTRLITAATESDEEGPSLSPEQIDRLLGL
jgi:hypothetical protein